MGTKRAFDEELQEFIKHPKHLDYGNKTALFAENKLPLETFQVVDIAGEGGGKYFRSHDGLDSENVITVPDMVDREFETSAPLPLVTGIGTGEDEAGPGPVFCPNLFPEFFEYNFPRRQLFHYDDAYTSLLNGSPRKEIPVGPDHQADVPEFDSEVARNYSSVFENDGMESFLGICVIPMCHSSSDSSNEHGEAWDIRTDCTCFDGGSVRCVRQHIKEARLKLRESLGHEKFVDLGMLDMGEEVACRWTEEEERLFHEVIYTNPASLGKMFWEQLSITFPFRKKKELVSYYFNVFILRRRAAQNGSKLLEINSDDDEWRGSDGGSFGVGIEDEDFVVGGAFAGHGDRESSSEDGDIDGNYDDDDDGGAGGEGDVIGVKEDSCTSFQHLEPNSYKQIDEKSSVTMHETKNTSEGVGSEHGLQSCDGKIWDPPYSSTRTTKGVDLLSTCSIIEEILGCSKNGENSIQ